MYKKNAKSKTGGHNLLLIFWGVLTLASFAFVSYYYINFKGWARLVISLMVSCLICAFWLWQIKKSESKNTIINLWNSTLGRQLSARQAIYSVIILSIVVFIVGFQSRISRDSLPIFQADSEGYLELAFQQESGQKWEIRGLRQFGYQVFLGLLFWIKNDFSFVFRVQEILGVAGSLLTGITVLLFLRTHKNNLQLFSVLLAFGAALCQCISPAVLNYERTIMAEALAIPLISLILALSATVATSAIRRRCTSYGVWALIVVFSVLMFFIKPNWGLAICFPIILYAIIQGEAVLRLWKHSLALTLLIVGTFIAFSSLENKFFRVSANPQGSYIAFLNLFAMNRPAILPLLNAEMEQTQDEQMKTVYRELRDMYNQADSQHQGRIRAQYVKLGYDGTWVVERLILEPSRSTIFGNLTPEEQTQALRGIVLKSMRCYPCLWAKKIVSELSYAYSPGVPCYNPRRELLSQYDLSRSLDHIDRMLPNWPSSSALLKVQSQTIDTLQAEDYSKNAWDDGQSTLFHSLNRLRGVLMILFALAILVPLLLGGKTEFCRIMESREIQGFLIAHGLIIGTFLTVSIAHALTYPRYRDLVIPATILSHCMMVAFVGRKIGGFLVSLETPNSATLKDCHTKISV